MKRRKVLICYQWKLFKAIGLSGNLQEIWWRYLGGIVMFSPILLKASIFGHQWIESNEQGLQIQGENIPLTTLLKEWCDVCHKHCVVDIDTKKKITLSLKDVSCSELYHYISHSVEASKLGDVVWFKKEIKGIFVRHLCLHRQASELVLSLKAILSPMGKYEHVMGDDATGILWVPRGFYEKHQELLEELDKPVSQYRLQLSWLRVTDGFLSQCHVSDEIVKDWLGGKFISISKNFWLDWIDKHQRHDGVTLLSQMDVMLRSGEVYRTNLYETLTAEIRDKRGSFGLKAVSQGLEFQIKTTQLMDKHILVNLNVLDKNGIPMGKTQSSEMFFDNTVSLLKDQSVILQGMTQNKQFYRRECKTLLSHVPVIGRLFCHYKKEREKVRYILVVSLT